MNKKFILLTLSSLIFITIYVHNSFEISNNIVTPNTWSSPPNYYPSSYDSLTGITSFSSITTMPTITSSLLPYSFIIDQENGNFISKDSNGSIISSNYWGDIVLQQTINQANEGQSIFIKVGPRSIVVVNNPISINKTGITINGESVCWCAQPDPQKTVRIWCGIANTPCIRTSSEYVKLNDVLIDSGNAKQIGLLINSSNSQFNVVTNGNFSNAVYIENSISSIFGRLEIHNPFNGLVLNGTCNDNFVTENTFDSVVITGYQNVGLWHVQCSDGNQINSLHLTPSNTNSNHYGIRYGSITSQGWFSGNYVSKLENSGGYGTNVLVDIYKDNQESIPPLIIGLYNAQGVYQKNFNAHIGSVLPVYLYSGVSN